MFNRLVLIIVGLIALPALSQEAAQTPSWMPKSFPAEFVLSDLSLARISADKKTVQIARPKFQTVTKTKTVVKQVFQLVTKTKTVEVGGKVETQAYTEQIPVNVEEEVTYNVSIPSGYDRFDVSIDKVKATDLTGKAIEVSALTSKLQKPTYVIAREGTFDGIDPFYLNLLRQDAIVICVPRGSIPAPAPVAPPAPAPAPVIDPSA
jgi:hypothetical protein